ncbi:hypothetical protein BB560_001769 [Smittium megazygosporum]|uniref:Uncharacterized protein n=1 Tax=Smittium megazygosporum TaxID=133381 RepID=A0A2T9ZGM7_9FUNG|nr:hypothetical protein BB560_001769 [Smittium megazygosporum]
MNLEVGSNIIQRLVEFVFRDPEHASSTEVKKTSRYTTNKTFNQVKRITHKNFENSKIKEKVGNTEKKLGSNSTIESSNDSHESDYTDDSFTSAVQSLSSSYTEKAGAPKEGLEESLKESLRLVTLTLGVSLFGCSNSRDSISKKMLSEKTQTNNTELEKKQPIVDIGIDVQNAFYYLIQKKNKNSRIIKPKTTFYFYNGSLISIASLSKEKNVSKLQDPVLVTTRNINGKYTALAYNDINNIIKTVDSQIDAIEEKSDISSDKNSTSPKDQSLKYKDEDDQKPTLSNISEKNLNKTMVVKQNTQKKDLKTKDTLSPKRPNIYSESVDGIDTSIRVEEQFSKNLLVPKEKINFENSVEDTPGTIVKYKNFTSAHKDDLELKVNDREENTLSEASWGPKNKILINKDKGSDFSDFDGKEANSTDVYKEQSDFDGKEANSTDVYKEQSDLMDLSRYSMSPADTKEIKMTRMMQMVVFHGLDLSMLKGL